MLHGDARGFLYLLSFSRVIWKNWHLSRNKISSVHFVAVLPVFQDPCRDLKVPFHGYALCTFVYVSVCIYIYFISFNLIFHLYIYSVIINIHATSFADSRLESIALYDHREIEGVPFWIFVEQFYHFSSNALSVLWERFVHLHFVLRIFSTRDSVLQQPFEEHRLKVSVNWYTEKTRQAYSTEILVEKYYSFVDRFSTKSADTGVHTIRRAPTETSEADFYARITK